MENKLNIIKSYFTELNLNETKLYNLTGQSSDFDYVFIATANERQAYAFFNKIRKDDNFSNYKIEGKNSSWILVDLGNIIIHLFNKEERQNYNLDLMWKQFVV